MVEVNIKISSESFDDRIIAIHHKTMATSKHMFLQICKAQHGCHAIVFLYAVLIGKI